ncbi:MAG: hypothetical protein U1F36_23370 [Planctomycetota bacterium]
MIPPAPFAIRLDLVRALLSPSSSDPPIRLLEARAGRVRLAFAPGVRTAWAAVSGGRTTPIEVRCGIGETALEVPATGPAVLVVSAGDATARFRLPPTG